MAIVTVVRACAQVAIPLIAFSVGLGSKVLHPEAFARQRGLLGRSLLATLLIVPVATVLLVKLLPVSPEVRGGLLTMAVAVGPVAALRRVGKGNGDIEYALGLNLFLLAISVVYVPIAVKILGSLFHRDIHVPILAVLKPVMIVQLVPLVAGLIVARLSPRVAAKLLKPASITGNALLGLVGIAIVALLWRPMVRIGAGGLLATLAAAILAIIVGHTLGGPTPRTRVVLASFCAVKFPMIAIVIATATQMGKRVLPVIMAYLLISLLAVVVYGLILKAVGPRGAATPRAAHAGAS
jgi:BASS family bile acid:Na+ symporter